MVQKHGPSWLPTWRFRNWTLFTWGVSNKYLTYAGGLMDFFLENSRTWKVLKNHFGPGKSWKLKLKVLEIPGKIYLKVMHFSSCSSGKQAAIVWHILLHAEFSAMDYTLNTVSKCHFFFIFKDSRASKRSWKIFHWVLESPGFFCR